MATNTPRVKRIIQFIEKLTVPSGKGEGSPFKMRPFQRKFIRDIYGSIDKNGRRVVRRAILSLGRKNGKGLAIDTPIPTPSGWKAMADIKKGDYVYDANGNPTRVTFVSEVHNNLQCWKLTFSDGSFVIADEQHQWFTTHRYRPWENYIKKKSGNGARPKRGIVTTPQIAESVKVLRPDGRNENNHKIQCAGALASGDIELPIPPYLLGLWLGDGSSHGPRLTCGDVDLKEITNAIKNEVGHSISISRQPGRSATINISDGIKHRTKDCFKKTLRNENLIRNKHIPEVYFNAGTEQRWALLQGLMDTDGTVTRCAGRTTPRCSFTTTKKDLALGTWRIARSLGLKATISERRATLNGRDIGDKWDVAFPSSIDNKIFRLERKQSLLPRSLGKRSCSISIVSCEQVESVPTKCIQVESRDSLFLCGHGCVPTHNTAQIACLALTHLVGPEAVKNGEIYSAANDRDQAALVFKYAAQIVRADPELESFIKIVDSTKTMVCFGNGSIYRAVSAEAGTKFGLNPTVVIFDELAQAKNRDLYDALDTSMAAREEPLFIVISTQSNDPQHILSQLIDDGLSGHDPTTVCHLYAVPDDADEEAIYSDQKLWKLANPALGDFRSLSEMKTAAKRAKRMPSFEASFRNLYLNQRVDAKSPLIPRAEWEGCRGDEEIEPESEIYLGLDLSGKTDLTALVAVSAGEKDIIRPWFWKPEATLRDHENRDRVPYWAWKQGGFLETTPGRAIQYDWVADRLARITREYRVLGMAYDRWSIDDLLNAMGRIGFDAYVDGKDKPRAGALRLVPWGQGFKDMGPAIDAMEVSILERKFVHDGNPVLTWCFSNAMAISDPAGNRKLDKSKARFRIDGAVAVTMAIGLKSRDMAEMPIDIPEQSGIMAF